MKQKCLKHIKKIYKYKLTYPQDIQQNTANKYYLYEKI